MNLKTRIKELGWTQKQAAQAIGINERTMRRYIAGTPMPKHKTLALEYAIAQVSCKTVQKI